MDKPTLGEVLEHEAMSPFEREIVEAMERHANRLEKSKTLTFTRLKKETLKVSPINQKRRYKVLPLKQYQKNQADRWPKALYLTGQVFKRDGWYLDRKSGLSWAEFGGKAWRTSSAEFLRSLAESKGNNRLDHGVYLALDVLHKHKLLKHAKLLEMYRIERKHRSEAATNRSVFLSMLKSGLLTALSEAVTSWQTQR